MSGEDYLAVIAIDFGTTFSGYAFSMKTHKNDITMNKNWGADVGFRSYKTPTTVLLRPDGSTHAFGFQAENEFTDLDEDERKEGYLLFQRFKMELFAHKKLDSNITIKSTTGEVKPAVDIIAKALAFMKKHCLEAISKSLASGIGEEYIRWVITVPAIWSDTAKKFMRLAAHKAGLVKDILSQNLIIALEPEAASLYCRTLAMDKFVGMAGVKGDMTLKPGEKYMIVDCGGGTIDITVHEVLEDGKVKEVKAASGGPWGGIFVDRKYFQLLDEIFGSDFMNTLKRDHPSTWLGMIVDFETKKRAVNPENATGTNMNLSLQFAKQFEKYAEEEVEDRIKKKKHLGVKYSNGMLRVSGDTVRGMYSEVIPHIKDHLHQIFHDCNGEKLSRMFVVGGFAESAYLQEFFNSHFGSKVQICIPEEAGMCITKGAVLFGHDTRVISSRIARFNYSVRARTIFDPTKHDESKMIIKDGEKKIVRLRPFVQMNETVKTDDVIEHMMHVNTDKTIVRCRLYCTTEDTDDPEHHSATCIETIRINSPILSSIHRKLKVSLRFGGTDILFKVVDIDSGNQAESTVQF